MLLHRAPRREVGARWGHTNRTTGKTEAVRTDRLEPPMPDDDDTFLVVECPEGQTKGTRGSMLVPIFPTAQFNPPAAQPSPTASAQPTPAATPAMRSSPSVAARQTPSTARPGTSPAASVSAAAGQLATVPQTTFAVGSRLRCEAESLGAGGTDTQHERRKHEPGQGWLAAAHVASSSAPPDDHHDDSSSDSDESFSDGSINHDPDPPSDHDGGAGSRAAVDPNTKWPLSPPFTGDTLPRLPTPVTGPTVRTTPLGDANVVVASRLEGLSAAARDGIVRDFSHVASIAAEAGRAGRDAEPSAMLATI